MDDENVRWRGEMTTNRYKFRSIKAHPFAKTIDSIGFPVEVCWSLPSYTHLIPPNSVTPQPTQETTRFPRQLSVLAGLHTDTNNHRSIQSETNFTENRFDPGSTRATICGASPRARAADTTSGFFSGPPMFGGPNKGASRT